MSDHESFDKDFLLILKLFLKESDPSDVYRDLVKKHIGEKNNEKYKSFKILNWEALFKDFKDIMNESLVETYKRFLECFNEEYFLKNKSNQAKDLRN